MIHWAALFDPTISILALIGRASFVYVGLYVMLRLFTFRHAGQMGVADLLLITLIASAVQNGMTHGETTVTAGMILAATIFFWSWFLDWLSARVPSLAWITQTEPRRIVHDGQMDVAAMRADLVTKGDLMRRSGKRASMNCTASRTPMSKATGPSRSRSARRDEGSMNVKLGVIATCLSVVAGSVDAIALAETGRFVSHMTGTTTHTASRLSDGSMLLVLLGALAIAAFLAGAGATGVVITAPGRRHEHSSKIAGLVATEAIIIGAAGLTMALLAKGTWTGMLTVAFFAFAMGLQNATTTYLLKPFERTTHVTSNMTDLGSEIGMRLRGLVGLPTSEVLAAPDGDTMASAAVCIVGFAVGGVAGAAVAHGLGNWSGLCAAILPVLVATFTTFAGPLLKDRQEA